MNRNRYFSFLFTSFAVVGAMSTTACIFDEKVPDDTWTTDSGEESDSGGTGTTEEGVTTDDSTTDDDWPSDPTETNNCNPVEEPAEPQEPQPNDQGGSQTQEESESPYVFDACDLLPAPTGFEDPVAAGQLKVDGQTYELGRTAFGGLVVEDEVGHLYHGFIMTLTPTHGCMPKVELSIIDLPSAPFEIDFKNNELCPGSFERNAMLALSLADGCAVLDPVSTGSLVVTALDDNNDGTIELSAKGSVFDGESSHPFELETFVDLSTIDSLVGIQLLYAEDICAL